MLDRVLFLAMAVSLALHLLLAAVPTPWEPNVEAPERIEVEILELPPPPVTEEPPPEQIEAEPEPEPEPPPPKPSRITVAVAVEPPAAERVAAVLERARDLSFGRGAAEPTVKLEAPVRAFDAAELISAEERAVFASDRRDLERLAKSLELPGDLSGAKLAPEPNVRQLVRPPLLQDESIGVNLGPLQIPEEEELADAPAPFSATESIQGPASKRRVISKPSEMLRVRLEAAWNLELQFWIEPDGRVGRVIPRKRGPADLEVAAMNYLRQWRFNPLPMGERETQWGIITFRFELQ